MPHWAILTAYVEAALTDEIIVAPSLHFVEDAGVGDAGGKAETPAATESDHP